MRPVSHRELVRRLRGFGFSGPYAGGPHEFMQRGRLKVSIPNPHRSDVPVWLLRQILKEAGVSVSDWEAAQ